MYSPFFFYVEKVRPSSGVLFVLRVAEVPQVPCAACLYNLLSMQVVHPHGNLPNFPAPLSCRCHDFGGCGPCCCALNPAPPAEPFHGHFVPLKTMSRVPDQTTRQTTTHYFQDEDRVGVGGSCDVYCGVEKVSSEEKCARTRYF
ncbi:hypothetical protein BaRGS_00005393 [Batillaria attramentaria]|uniref:Uncharacterized protein n=1 Tax=Batillaria attramentaria TaxID=370345 RepID=A0ABD0LWY1_9CAEN